MYLIQFSHHLVIHGKEKVHQKINKTNFNYLVVMNDDIFLVLHLNLN